MEEVQTIHKVVHGVGRGIVVLERHLENRGSESQELVGVRVVVVVVVVGWGGGGQQNSFREHSFQSNFIVGRIICINLPSMILSRYV